MEDSGLHHKPSTHHEKRHEASTSELLASAKLVAEAAKSAASHETDKVDKGRVAGAAADLLGAASHYGHLEEKSFGQYIEKAETYLHQYHSSQSSTTTTSSGHSATVPHKASHSEDDDGGSGGGYGDYLKMAGSFLKKH